MEGKFQTTSIFKTALGAVSLLALFGFIFWAASLPFSKDLDKRHFDGKVIDKWIQISETQEGSVKYPKALVENHGGEKIRLDLDWQTYEKIKIGD